VSALAALGLFSIAATIAFTLHQCRAEQGGGQTKRGALAEAWLNIAVGFSVNYVANMLLLPLVGASMSLIQNFWLGCIFTGISVVRSYVIRRHFNSRLTQATRLLVGSK
jgi:hypothetical protein